MSDDNVTLPDDDPVDPDGAETNPEDVPPTEAGAGGPPPPTCAECGFPLDEGQPYCLECGAPTPSAPKLPGRMGPGWVLALALLALGIGAGALAYASLNEDDSASLPTMSTGLPSLPTTSFPTTTTGVDVTTDTTTFPTSPTGTTTFPTTPTGTTTFPTTPTDTTTTTFTTPTTTPTTPSGTAQDSWPDGTSGWTVILSTTTSADDAVAFRDQVRATGRSAGLLDTSLYATLEPDFWAVFSGVYTNRQQAIDQAKVLSATYPGAYAARIEEA